MLQMKQLLTCCLCALALQGVVVAQDNVIDRVEWVVGDKAILRSDIEEAVQAWLANGQRFQGDPYCVVGEELAVQQLFLHQAALDSIPVNESYIMQIVDKRMDYALQNLGFRYYLGFCDDGKPWCSITAQYVRQGRILVTGSNMAYHADWFTNLFDPSSILDSTRGEIPQ